LDFLVGDVIEDANLLNAETELGSSQPAKALDSTLGDFGWLVPKMGFERILDRRTLVRRKPSKAHGRAWGQDDLETHLATI
jgi:hypothetical protein